MYINSTVKKFIETYINSINDKQWEHVLTVLSIEDKFVRNDVLSIFINANIDFLEDVVYIPENAFFQCSCIKKIQIPPTIRTIRKSAFYSCTNLKSIQLPDQLEDIQPYAFSKCSNLASITIPDSMKYISYFTFQDCSNLISITIPNTIRTITMNAFSGCYNLTDVYFHGTVDQWKQIHIEQAGNEELLFAIIHCDDGIISD